MESSAPLLFYTGIIVCNNVYMFFSDCIVCYCPSISRLSYAFQDETHDNKSKIYLYLLTIVVESTGYLMEGHIPSSPYYCLLLSSFLEVLTKKLYGRIVKDIRLLSDYSPYSFPGEVEESSQHDIKILSKPF
ncbi:hypothetical protein TNCV_5112461 [Trichonephila clavipes]|nr:hypothetical protein TNCV_5112461 [Trichonephila clavipes]